LRRMVRMRRQVQYAGTLFNAEDCPSSALRDLPDGKRKYP
jgi:hypothetical protein